MTQAATAPGPKGNVLFRPDFNVRKRTHLYLQKLEKNYGNISKIKFGPFDVVFLSNPDYIEHMLLHRETYVKVKEGGMLRHLLGNGLRLPRPRRSSLRLRRGRTMCLCLSAISSEILRPPSA